MGLLDLNDAESVRNGLDQTREELRLQTQGIWPSRSMVPEHQRPSYRETLVAQARYLERRLARLAEVKSE